MANSSFNKRRNKNKPTGNSPNSRNSSNKSGQSKSRKGNQGNRRPARGGGFKKSTLDPSLLVKKATVTEVKEYRSDRLISELPVNQELRDCLTNKGFERPTEIQDRTLETLLDGRDLLGIAQTGTGKTGAFLIPIIDQLQHHNKKPYALVLVPTRELATQVEDEFKSMTKGMGLYSACFIGGTNINKDINILRRPSHVVIATPGRLLDLVNRKLIDLGKFHTLVLDEFDRMLDMGFVHDVKRVIHAMQNRKQTLLFSATLDLNQQKLIESILHDFATVKVSMGDSTSDTIDQEIIEVSPGEDKFQILRDMLSNEDFEKILVFEETKHWVSRLCKKLNKSGIKADEIHGNKSQNARQRALNSFKNGDVRVLVATDVAARGIDVSDVTHVINYQVPQSFDSYIHRIGRTGRAGKTGKAYTFVD